MNHFLLSIMYTCTREDCPQFFDLKAHFVTSFLFSFSKKLMYIVSRSTYIRNAGWLPSVLRRQPVRYLREDIERSSGVAETPGPCCQGHHQETTRARPNQEAGQHEGIYHFYYIVFSLYKTTPT